MLFASDSTSRMVVDLFKPTIVQRNISSKSTMNSEALMTLKMVGIFEEMFPCH